MLNIIFGFIAASWLVIAVFGSSLITGLLLMLAWNDWLHFSHMPYIVGVGIMLMVQTGLFIIKNS